MARDRMVDGPAMNPLNSLSPFARQVWSALSAEYPEWTEYLGRCGEDDLEVAVPAPPRSKVGHLVIFTSDGKDLWIRFSPPRMCYALDNETEMLAIIRQLQTESAFFVTIWEGDEWVETTLIRPDDQPELEPNQVAHVVSWSGKHDRTINAANRLGPDTTS